MREVAGTIVTEDDEDCQMGKVRNALMAYLVELDVDECGCLDGDESAFPLTADQHDWNTPYPRVERAVEFEWEAGEGDGRPDVFWYPQILDWVCDERAYRVLQRVAGADIHTLAEGVLDGEPVFVVQAPHVLDVVDREASLIDTYPTYEALRFPAFRRSAADALAARVFRVPGGITMVFVGERVKQALDEAGVKGITYVPVDWGDG
ncbi:hypothetical protein ACFYO2_28375 [Streptomyces sp. NPDC006602]|uniref:hypothetical protein n=1 Tax=Streptomyces sp. NPDC006602 TaxID=3364751 RepID=UPI0036BFF694